MNVWHARFANGTEYPVRQCAMSPIEEGLLLLEIPDEIPFSDVMVLLSVPANLMEIVFQRNEGDAPKTFTGFTRMTDCEYHAGVSTVARLRREAEA